MKIDKLLLVGGSDIPIADGVFVRQPTLDELRQPEIGDARYKQLVNVFALTAKTLLEGNTIIPAEMAAHMHVFDLLIGIDGLRDLLTDSLQMFIRGGVTLRREDGCYTTAAGGVINRSNFDTLRSVVLQINNLAEPKTEKPQYYSEKARAIFEKIGRFREEAAERRRKSGNDDLEIPNVISKLSAKHPSLNLTNIWSLTVWQLFDQFSCTCVNAQIDIIGLRWAAWGKEDFDFSQWYKHIDP